MRRFVGFVQVFTSIIWITVCVAALVLGLKLIDATAGAIDSSLNAAQNGLDRLQEALLVSPEVVDGMHDILVNLESMAIKTSEALEATQPLLDKATQVTTQDIPNAMQGLSDVVPRIVTTVSSVERALEALSKFNIRIPNPLGKDLMFDLGINYSSEAPMSQAFGDMGDQIQAMPSSLRELQTAFDEAGENLSLVSLNMNNLANSVGTIDDQLTVLGPQILNATFRLTDAHNELGMARVQVSRTAIWAKWILGFLAIALGITAVPSLYRGWLWIRGRSTPEE